MFDFHSILNELGSGHMTTTAYDTAWVARLSEIDRDLGNKALQWLTEHQLPDGSWGVEPMYYHDRVISTLAAMIALNNRGRRAQDKIQIEHGLQALDRITDSATRGLTAEANMATVGFELIVPTLVAEAERLGVIKQQGDRILGRLGRLRTAKLSKLSGLKINRYISTAFSAEMAGTDMQSLLDIDNLQEQNGSVGNSPSATAYLALFAKKGDERALDYLHNHLRNGGAPFASPFDIFERSWVLWNISLTRIQDKDVLDLCQPHLNFLQNAWRPGQGVGFSASYSTCDGDDTSVTFDTLLRFSHRADVEAIHSYEEERYFRCYSFEANPSIGANIHILSALRQAGYDKNHPSVQKIIRFLRQTREPGKYWVDKWHISPYYITAHAIMALRGLDDEACTESVEWILRTQRADGSWGGFNLATAEETAYCIQALSLWQRYRGGIPQGRLQQAAFWLGRNAEPPYPPLWISKALYCPELVVKSAIASAIILANG